MRTLSGGILFVESLGIHLHFNHIRDLQEREAVPLNLILMLPSKIRVSEFGKCWAPKSWCNYFVI